MFSDLHTVRQKKCTLISTLVHKLSRFEDQKSNILKKEQKIKSPKIQPSKMMDPIAKRLSLFGPIQQESIASVKDSHLDHLSFLFPPTNTGIKESTPLHEWTPPSTLSALAYWISLADATGREDAHPLQKRTQSLVGFCIL